MLEDWKENSHYDPTFGIGELLRVMFERMPIFPKRIATRIALIRGNVLFCHSRYGYPTTLGASCVAIFFVGYYVFAQQPSMICSDNVRWKTAHSDGLTPTVLGFQLYF